MPGKCLSAQTEGDKCCWRGHDRLATVNLRTRSPTGGPGVDTIHDDCWMCCTALMKRINKKWEAPPHPRHPLTTATHILLQPPLSFHCKLFDVSLFLLDSQLWFWSRFDFLCRIRYILWKQYKPPIERQGVPKLSLLQDCMPNRAMTEVNLLLTHRHTKAKSVPKQWQKGTKCKVKCKVSSYLWWFLFKVVMAVHCLLSLREEREYCAFISGTSEDLALLF